MADPARVSRGGMVSRILQSWWAPREVVRGLVAMPESVKLVVLLFAMVVYLAAQAPGNARAAELDSSVPFDARMGGALFAVMFLMPLLAYAVATLVSLIFRLTPWRLADADSRLALFWALMAVTPAVLLSGLVDGFIGPGLEYTITQVISGIGFIWIWGAGISALAKRK